MTLKNKLLALKLSPYINMNHDSLIKGLCEKYSDRWINVELTNRCNLNCPLCSTGSGFNKKQRGNMDFDRYRSFMDTCSPLFDTVSFMGSGEPTMHPRFLDFVKYTAVEKNLYTTCCTNGTWIKDFNAMVNSGLGEIHFDIEGLTSEQHRVYRRGADLDVVLNNLKLLVKTRDKEGLNHPLIYIDTLISKFNENSYEGFIKLAREIGTDGIFIRGINEDLYDSADWFPVTDKFKHVKRDGDYLCRFKNLLAGVLSWDGDIFLCCMTPHHEFPVIKANVFDNDNFLESIDSDDFYNITIKAGEYDFCHNCFFKRYITYDESILF